MKCYIRSVFGYSGQQFQCLMTHNELVFVTNISQTLLHGVASFLSHTNKVPQLHTTNPYFLYYTSGINCSCLNVVKLLKHGGCGQQSFYMLLKKTKTCLYIIPRLQNIFIHSCTLQQRSISY